jgi:hypothetical protein
VSGNITGGTAINATTSVTAATFMSVGLTTNNNGARIIVNGSNLSRNFHIANNWNVGGAFEITSSTTNGGNTFTTPNFVIAGATGNVLIGTTTDAGYKLDVNGTARIVSNLTIGQGAYMYSQGYNNLFFPFQYGQSAIYGAGGTSINNSTPSGTKGTFYDAISFVPVGGTATFASFLAAPTINQTGGANGITRGLYVNPTLTAAADFRAIEVTAGITILGAATTAKASLRIPSGTAPTSPVNGDIWFDGTDIKMRIGGVTKTFTLL